MHAPATADAQHMLKEEQFRLMKKGALFINTGRGPMVRGSAADQERAVARALELGINFFDTAAAYGDGESERNLGRVLKTLRPQVFVSTKFTILDEDRGAIGAAVAASLEASLKRLG